jgi:spoIIIJ-associated protein
MDGRDSGMLVDNDGELISALQFLFNRMSRRAWPGVGRIRLSCDGQPGGRDDEVVELARRMIAQVERSGRPRRLKPMNAYERRLVHLTVREHAGVGSRSEGDGHLKRVRIFTQK